MPLIYASQNKKLLVTSIKGGKHLLSKLTSMGIIPGKEIKVIRQNRFDSTIIAVDNCRYAIGRGIAMKIFVKVKEE